MAEDTEVLRQIWDGRVPISFRLASEEICSLDQPEQVFLFVHRMTYLPLVIDRVQRYFSKFIEHASSGAGEMWLEDENGAPVQWHYPVGVLYDMAMSSSVCPWPVTVHFRDFPEQSLMHCASRDVIESYFMSSIKEADFLKHRGQVVNAMQKKEHKQLFQSLVNDKFDAFWAVNRKLMEHLPGDPGFRSIPFRIHRQDHAYVQTQFQPFSSGSATPHTLYDLVSRVLPDVSDWESGWRIIIHGTEVPLVSQVQWLSEHMSHADNFLHICILSAS